MRITLDVNILVRALISPKGPAQRLLQLVADSLKHDLVLSVAMLEELSRVLSYTRLQSRRKLTPEMIEGFQRLLEPRAELVEPEMGLPIVLSDPDDDVVVYTAVAGDAEILCTLNSRDFSKPNVVGFCKEHGIRIMTDVELLRLLVEEAES